MKTDALMRRKRLLAQTYLQARKRHRRLLQRRLQRTLKRVEAFRQRCEEERAHE